MFQVPRPGIPLFYRKPVCELEKSTSSWYIIILWGPLWIVFSSVRQACVVTNLHNCTKQPCQRYINKALNELSRKPEEDRSTTNWHYSTVEQRGKNEWLCGHERQRIALLSSLSFYRHTCLGLYWLSVLDGPYSVKKIKCLWWEASYSPRCIS